MNDPFIIRLTEKGMFIAEEHRQVFQSTRSRLSEHIPRCPEADVMLQKLQEAEFWAVKALAVHHSEQE